MKIDIGYLKETIKNRNFKIKKWKLSKENPNWGHDHCRICMKEISNLRSKENIAYTNGFDWICKSCFRKYKARLNLIE